MTLTTSTSTTTRQPIVAVATEKVSGTGLLEAAYGGKVSFSKQRSTGTLRHWPVLAPGSAQRKQAEEVAKARAAKQPVEAIAKSLSVSVPTVRRVITALAFTLELEGMSAKDRAALAKVATANGEAVAKAEAAKAPKEPVKEEKPASKPKASTSKPKAQPKAPAKPKASTKGRKETPGQRVKRMQSEGKAPVKSASAE